MKSNPKLADLGLERADLSRREELCEKASMEIMARRIFEEDRSGRNLDLVSDDLEYGAPTRAEPLPVFERLFDIGESRECEEVVFLVVVERRLFL